MFSLAGSGTEQFGGTVTKAFEGLVLGGAGLMEEEGDPRSRRSGLRPVLTGAGDCYQGGPVSGTAGWCRLSAGTLPQGCLSALPPGGWLPLAEHPRGSKGEALMSFMNPEVTRQCFCNILSVI